MKVALSFPEIARALERLPLPPFDLVVGVARGGVVPASLLAARLQCDLAVVRLQYRDDDNHPLHEAPVAEGPVRLPEGARTVLLVDDVAVTGRTMDAARRLLEGYDVTTLVLKGRANVVVFPHITTCVAWPWHAASHLASHPQPATPA